MAYKPGHMGHACKSNEPVPPPECLWKMTPWGAPRGAQSVKPPTLGFYSGPDLIVLGSIPGMGSVSLPGTQHGNKDITEGWPPEGRE